MPTSRWATACSTRPRRTRTRRKRCRASAIRTSRSSKEPAGSVTRCGSAHEINTRSSTKPRATSPMPRTTGAARSRSGSASIPRRISSQVFVTRFRLPTKPSTTRPSGSTLRGRTRDSFAWGCSATSMHGIPMVCRRTNIRCSPIDSSWWTSRRFNQTAGRTSSSPITV